MKTSIKKLLSSVQFNATLLILFTLLSGLLLASSYATYKRIDNMAEQERLVHSLAKMDRADPALDRIRASGVLSRLPILIDALDSENVYEIANSLIFREAKTRSKYTNLLRERDRVLNASASAYFNASVDSPSRRDDMLRAIENYTTLFYPLTKLQNNTLYQYSLLVGAMLILVLLWGFVVMTAARNASKTILGDIYALQPQEGATRASVKFKTTEINTIALKIRQESGDAASANGKKDEVTQLPNYEGVKIGFDRRPKASKDMHAFVCIFEIDNYSKLVNHFPQSVIDPILIKITSIMKLHKMQNDQIGRIHGGQFIAVLLRSDKHKALEECNHIRQMIEENRFKMPHDSFPITLSGGFASKTASQTLDDAVKNAKERLRMAQEKGGNCVSDTNNNTKML
ncbi:diguanylate cyclase [Sulfurimonas sp. HSL1-6]|uniref:GGDEF domain-containing protein n=1 Tax=Thiomicrolovo immobilis TaxID=3131935 RepID=UPI0031F89D3E